MAFREVKELSPLLRRVTIFGVSKGDVDKEVTRLFAEYPPAGYGTHIVSGPSASFLSDGMPCYIATVTHSVTCD